MQRIEITYQQMIFIGLGVGFVFGLIPLILGVIKGKKNLAILGFIACVVTGGVVWSLLSVVTAIVFVWLILRKPVENDSTKVEVVNEKPVEVPVKDSENL